jgi:hypothetical protein
MTRISRHGAVQEHRRTGRSGNARHAFGRALIPVATQIAVLNKHPRLRCDPVRAKDETRDDTRAFLLLARTNAGVPATAGVN